MSLVASVRVLAGRLSAAGALLASVLVAVPSAADETATPASRLEALDAVELLPPSARTAPAGLALAGHWLLNGEELAAAALLQEVLSLAALLEDSDSASSARTLLAGVDRLWLRPVAGRGRWRQSRVVRPSGLELKKPNGIAARGNGDLIVTDPALGSVVHCAASGAVHTTWNLPNARRPSWGPGGGVVAETKSGSRTLARPPAGVAEPAVAAAAEDAIDSARDASGALWVLGRKGGLVRHAADGSVSKPAMLPQVRKPAAIAVDRLGNLYVLDGGARRVFVVDPAGGVLTSLGPALPGGLELGRPEDIAVDDAGRLFFADRKIGIVVLE